MEIQIADEFTNAVGEFPNYDAIPLNQREQLREQEHVDIRLFNDEPLLTSVNMLHLDLLTLYEIGQLSMDQISTDFGAKIVLRTGEKWTAGTVTRQTDRNYWHGISLSCTTGGPNVTESVMI